jgi:iron complex transport system permease protein
MSKSTISLWSIMILAPVVLGCCLLLGASGIGLPDLETQAGQAILRLRLSRVAGGFIVGAGLSCAGVVFQALLRNPLAEPYILGVSSGAGLGAAVAILTGIAAASPVVLPVTAFIAAAATLLLVFLIASDGGTPSVYSLILSGVILSSICSSVLMFLVATAPITGLHSVVWWMLGNLQPNTVGVLSTSAVIIGAGCAVAWAISPELNALTLGREAAHHVGVHTSLIVLVGLGAATLASAAAVAMSGLIGFVGLIVPHVVRNLMGPDHRRLLPAAFVGGGTFLALCDALARTVLTPIEIPVGVITALCGGPFFLVILRTRRRHGWIE